MSRTVSGWYFDFSWFLGLDRSVFHLRYMLMNYTYEVRLILVYTYEYLCNFFVQSNKKTPLSLPLQLPEQNVTWCATTKKFLSRNQAYAKYIHTVCAARAEIQGLFLVVCSRYPSLNDLRKLEDMAFSRELSFLSFIILWHSSSCWQQYCGQELKSGYVVQKAILVRVKIFELCQTRVEGKKNHTHTSKYIFILCGFLLLISYRNKITINMYLIFVHGLKH